MEVEYIWQGKKTPLMFLFLLNRYAIPLGFFAHQSLSFPGLDSWDEHVNVRDDFCNHDTINQLNHPARCRQFFHFEGFLTLLGLGTAGLMMSIRIHALYRNQLKVVFVVVFLLALWSATHVWLLTKATIRSVDPTIPCTIIFDTKSAAEGVLVSSTVWLQLVYDTVVFGLTIYRTYPMIRGETRSNIARKLIEDGLLYYLVIFTTALGLTLANSLAPNVSSYLANQLVSLLFVTMMSRITLNLKKFSRLEGSEPTSSSTLSRTAASRMIPRFLTNTRRNGDGIISTNIELTGARTQTNMMGPLAPKREFRSGEVGFDGNSDGASPAVYHIHDQ
ncbi:hypothetical protein PM082_022111 [Marasmius tenuissimus]|nr:hypothetical protein PM082_022111 [Marasmius tenuissimus]